MDAESDFVRQDAWATGLAGRAGVLVDFFLGRRPSRCACLRASLRERLIASAFWRVRFSDGFSYARRAFISRNTPSRRIFFFRTLRACSTLLSLTITCNGLPSSSI